jgi:hypothetical protein
MFQHKCTIEEMRIVADRPNPINESWNPWTLVACQRCGAVEEWQHHSEEEMHGVDLEVVALPSSTYIRVQYQLTEADIDEVIKGKKKARRYDRYTHQYREA